MLTKCTAYCTIKNVTISHVLYLEASVTLKISTAILLLMITPLVYIIVAISVLCEKRNEFYVQSGTKFHQKFSMVIYKVHTPTNAHFIKLDKVLKFTLKSL